MFSHVKREIHRLWRSAAAEPGDALGVYASLNRRATRVAGGITNQLAHAMNLPTAPDLDKIHQRLSAIDSHISS